jgi:hypothetical protein
VPNILFKGNDSLSRHISFLMNHAHGACVKYLYAMKKFFILAFVATILTGCSSIVPKSANPKVVNTTTYTKADVSGPKVSIVADLEISPVKISYSYVPSKAVGNGGFDNILNSAVQETLYKNGQADVLVALEYHAEFDKKGKCELIIVTGYPAKYKNLRTSDCRGCVGVSGVSVKNDMSAEVKSTTTTIVAEKESQSQPIARATDDAQSESRSPVNLKVADNAEVQTKQQAKAETENMGSSERGANVKTSANPAQTAMAVVDLGLPSGILWASCNVGASVPEESGSYFAWGETSVKNNYSSSNSVTYDKRVNKVAGNANYDAATAKLGSPWQIPTNEDFEELIDKCVWKWTAVNGVNGYRVTGPNGKSIFLPATGYREGSSCNNRGASGGYWSSTPHDNTIYSYGLCYDDVGFYMFWNNRYEGRCIRPVKK